MAYHFTRRRAWLLISVVGLIALCFAVASYRNRDQHDPRPVFLVTGDFKKSGDFSKDVLVGANVAADSLEASAFPRKPIIQPLDTEGRVSESAFRDAFLEYYTTRNIRAVISADISTVASIVVKTANSYHVPVLLTVATNDEVLTHNRRGDLTFRLGPTDTKQAELLSSWLRDKSRPAIIHGGQTPYGRFLGSETIERVAQLRSASQSPTIITDYMPGSDLFTVLSPMKTTGVDAIAFVGYADRFKEFYGKLKALDIEVPVLLSDGCYTPSLIHHPPEGDFSLSFPVNPVRRSDGIQANGVFGFDAYTLLAHTFSHTERKLALDQSFPSTFRATAKEESVKKRLLSRYEFNSSGENELARFGLFRLTPEVPSH